MQPNFLFSWPYSRLAIASPDHQLAIMRQQGLETSAEKEAELLERCELEPPTNETTRSVHVEAIGFSLSLSQAARRGVRPPSL